MFFNIYFSPLNAKEIQMQKKNLRGAWKKEAKYLRSEIQQMKAI